MSKKTKDIYFFPKSRIPIYFLFDYIIEGLSWSDFHSSYPWLRKKDIIQVIKQQKNYYSLDDIKEKEAQSPVLR